MKLLSLEPESSASANSAIPTYFIVLYGSRAPRDSCGARHLQSRFAASPLSTAAPFRSPLIIHRMRSISTLPIPPYPHILSFCMAAAPHNRNRITRYYTYKTAGCQVELLALDNPFLIFTAQFQYFSYWLSQFQKIQNYHFGKGIVKQQKNSVPRN